MDDPGIGTSTNTLNKDRKADNADILTDIADADRRVDNPSKNLNNKYKQRSQWLKYKYRQQIQIKEPMTQI